MACESVRGSLEAKLSGRKHQGGGADEGLDDKGLEIDLELRPPSLEQVSSIAPSLPSSFLSLSFPHLPTLSYTLLFCPAPSPPRHHALIPFPPTLPSLILFM